LVVEASTDAAALHWRADGEFDDFERIGQPFCNSGSVQLLHNLVMPPLSGLADVTVTETTQVAAITTERRDTTVSIARRVTFQCTLKLPYDVLALLIWRRPERRPVSINKFISPAHDIIRRQDDDVYF
jgi:hypothetical protein